MIETTEDSACDRAREAAAAGQWQQAFDLLARADAGTRLRNGTALALFADVAYAAGHPDVTIAVWERAYVDAVRVGDQLAAAGAAVRVALHLLFDAALMAPVRGWLTRAEVLLNDHDETPAHAWLAVVRNYERLLAGDFENAQEWARRAVAIGAKCDPAAAAMGRVAEARSLILDGEVRRGLAMLDEAAVATVSGELDALSTGVVYCELVCALQALAQYDSAEQWTEAMERWASRNSVGSIHGRCRVHRAEILRLRGSFDEAENEARAACEELRPYLRRELGWPLTELGRIRFRKGDLPGAEDAFLAAHQAGWDPQPGLALVRLAQGDVALAVASIRDALDHPMNVPSKELPPNTGLRRAPLLEAQVEIEIAGGDLNRARCAADELEQVATRFESKAFAASAALARGRIRLAEGDPVGARGDLEAGARLWNEVGAPYEAALARVGLAEAYRREGREEAALLALRAAGSAFEQIGAAHQVERAARASRDVLQGSAATSSMETRRHLAIKAAADVAGGNLAPTADVNLFRREGDFWLVVFEGHTTRLRDRKGLRYLARLLQEPGREYHVLDLVTEARGYTTKRRAPESELPSPGHADAGELLDARAKEAYRRRLAEIEDDVDEARALGDAERAAQAEAERDFLVRELARAVGLGGRDRRAASASERARVSVTRAVRQGIERTREYNVPLASHLDHAVRTGTYCAYAPDPRAPVTWRL